jgi:hypothetical protein
MESMNQCGLNSQLDAAMVDGQSSICNALTTGDGLNSRRGSTIEECLSSNALTTGDGLNSRHDLVGREGRLSSDALPTDFYTSSDFRHSSNASTFYPPAIMNRTMPIVRACLARSLVR